MENKFQNSENYITIKLKISACKSDKTNWLYYTKEIAITFLRENAIRTNLFRFMWTFKFNSRKKSDFYSTYADDIQ